MKIIKGLILILMSFGLGMFFSYYSYPCGIDTDCVVDDMTNNYGVYEISAGVGLIPVNKTSKISFRGKDYISQEITTDHSVCFNSFFKEYRENEEVLKDKVIKTMEGRLNKCQKR